MSNYYNKYIKYKFKYLNLLKNTNIQLGSGDLKVFDLSEDHEFRKGELEKNLKKLEKEYGGKFIIKSAKSNLEVEVSFYKIKLPSDLEIYRMKYDIPNRTTYLTPFIIDFFDPTKSEINSNSYIYDIQKTDKITGTQMVKLCLEINEVLGVNKVFLFDGATIKCGKKDLNLSFIKLLEYGKTFYMKLGFDFEITDHLSPYYRFKSKTKFKKEFDKLLENIKLIETIDIIKEYEKTLDTINLMIKENYKEDFKIYYDNSYPVELETYLEPNPKDSIQEIFEECNEVLEILNENKDNKYLYEILIDLFKTNCEDYYTLYTYIISNQRKKLTYGEIEISRPYINDFNFFIEYIHKFYYSYTFEK